MTGEMERGACAMTEQIVGWALHSLEPDEEMAAIEHLRSCAVCRQSAAEVAEVTSGLASAVEQRDPPPELRRSIVELAEQTPQERSSAVRAERSRVEAAGLSSSGPRHRVPQQGPVPSRPSGRPSRWGSRGRGRMLVAAVTVVAVLAGGGAVIGYAQQMRTERDASLAQTQNIFDMVARMDRPGASHAFLAAAPNAQPVAAVMVDDGPPTVISVGLSPNSVDEQTYVLWGLNGTGSPQAVGTFDVRPTPGSPISVRSASGGSFSTYAISLEKGRQAPAAPSAVLASGQVET